jgi:predicted unusual protein kinase regulating ubiquinone biosynthesis (AarF/ABC1/UbiB family)
MYFLRFGKLFFTLIYLMLYYCISYFFPSLWKESHFISVLSNSGTLVIKLGQLLSLRPDICGTTLSIILSKLRKTVTIVKLDLFSIIPGNIRLAINSFNQVPIACGSIAQVYRANIWVNGKSKRVVFKILKPGILQEIKEDLIILKTFARWIDYFRPTLRAKACLDKLSELIIRQTDFISEKENMLHFKLKGYNTPHIYEECSNNTILCLEYIRSSPISEQTKYNLFTSLCHKMLSNPCFLHLDLHPGNVIYSKDKIYIIDVGLASAIEEDLYTLFMASIMALINKNYLQFSKLFLLGKPIPADWIEFITSLFPDGNVTIITITKIFLSILGSCHKYGVNIDERMSSIVMGLVVINGHYNELCSAAEMENNFISDILLNNS